jgi:hypothetical protein
MATNPILDELYGIRSKILADHGDDLNGYLQAEFERLKTEGHPIAKIKQRTIRYTEAAKSGESAVEDQSSPLGDR